MKRSDAAERQDRREAFATLGHRLAMIVVECLSDTDPLKDEFRRAALVKRQAAMKKPRTAP
ncbi:hypothetical protein JANAI62_03890 [Jannaschia pagri]|uniref:Uncharacterized protein n=1 Tax=Jannaschia pagri TaxID=2829797 RepID=A0ABQ4NHK8_9RHOB|nr:MULTISPECIES: hypothetical protein [unclassified Jannaschia]GIT90128.1 hypothetical protein JANAI61_05860 [Jannaschia sp. AI_61]GIT93766.1 hypothetical protein JANAI62_03890 [Jannaschia sp. AI_62]